MSKYIKNRLQVFALPMRWGPELVKSLKFGSKAKKFENSQKVEANQEGLMFKKLI